MTPNLTPLRDVIEMSPLGKVDTSLGRVVVRWLIGVVLCFGLIGCVTKGADSPADPYLASPGSSGTGAALRRPLPDFSETKVLVRTADGELEWCLLLAATPAQRARGLMEIMDVTLGGYDGMLFRYAQDTDERFWMRNTPMPLSIAYISADGQLVATTDMAPCEDRDDCPLYPESGPPPPYRMAIEVPEGRLPALGIGPDSIVTDTNARCV